MAFTQYNAGQIHDLLGKLDGLGKELTQQNSDVQKAVSDILAVLDESSEMYTALQTAQANWSKEFENTVTTVLANLGVGAQNALGNAQYADVKIAGSFAGR